MFAARSLRSILAILTLFLTFEVSLAKESRSIGLLLDESARVPMRVEANIISDIARELIDENSLTILVPTEEGIVDRSGMKVDPTAFDAIWIYQGDAIVQDSALFSPATVAELKSFVDSAPTKGVLLTGGAVALFDKLGNEGALTIDPLTFGEARNQAGLIPIARGSSLFEGVDLDRNVGWITNAAFPAFARFASAAPNAALVASTPFGGEPNPMLFGLDEQRATVKVVAFGWRVDPLFDAAPQRYQDNFKALLANALARAGERFLESDAIAPLFTAPNFDALTRALDYFDENFEEDEYPNGKDYRARLDALRALAEELERDASATDADPTAIASRADALQADFNALQKEALLDSPELDFDELLFVKRDPAHLGLPVNYGSDCALPPLGYSDELRRYNLRTNETKLVYKPENGEIVSDIELYYDASKIMFSSPDVNANNRWRLWELPLNENAPKPTLLSLLNAPDVDNYDACYLPDDRVLFCSTASMTGVPCVNGSINVCNLYLKELDGSIRQLTIEQDHDWNPVVMNNGRVMYLRWEYVDLPHAFSRIMFHMNPDGTNQSELYGSGSYWPNAIFYARPLPGDSGKFVGIVGGHHEKPRVGDLVIFDPSLGRKEATGAIQRVPGYGKPVEPIMCDLPIAQNYPIFLQPYPISETLFLVSCQRAPNAPWQICLADVFDNIATVVDLGTDAALEPTPLREIERQPILPDRVDLDSKTADVFIADIYEGQGLQGVERGEVKALRVLSYEFAYQGMGAEPYSVGLDGPWDPRRILGTVPVNEDGSASFKIPAYAPIALQPLDKNGQAIQLMRSWITAMPGETVSCVGCHEMQNSTSSTAPRGLASKSLPVEIEPFYGETRGFSYAKEIRPIVERYCLDCHHKGSERVAKMIEDGLVDPKVLGSQVRAGQVFEDSLLPDFSPSEPKPALAAPAYIAAASPFPNDYYQLRRYVRTPTKECDMAVLKPYEFCADATLLVQLLRRGHYGVELDRRSWDELITWIDLNAPCYGSWGEILKANNELVQKQYERREALREAYAPSSESIDDAPIAEVGSAPIDAQDRERFSIVKEADVEMALDENVKEATAFTAPLAEGVALEMTTVPGAKICVSRCEITNEQYRAFDPSFSSGIGYGDFIQFSPGERGWSLDAPKLPAVRVSWNDAVKFCEWLSEKTGDEYRLPTEQEWRYFASAGTSADFWFGGLDVDNAPYENLGDVSYAKISPFGWTGRVDTLPEWRPVDFDRDDRSRLAAPVASYAPNPFGLFDVQGNVAEWTSSQLVEKTTILDANGAVEKELETPKKVVCGGSWTTPARLATIDARRALPATYAPMDVGFRVVCVKKN